MSDLTELGLHIRSNVTRTKGRYRGWRVERTNTAKQPQNQNQTGRGKGAPGGGLKSFKIGSDKAALGQVVFEQNRTSLMMEVCACVCGCVLCSGQREQQVQDPQRDHCDWRPETVLARPVPQPTEQK